jgi:hypothetical protein
MPLPGGATDKFGNRYEGRWTVYCMIKVLNEKADSIRLEPPGIEGAGVEFWISKAGKREYHQVKRQQSASGRWTLTDLEGKEILSKFWEKLQNPTSVCVFVSSHAAFQLDELSDRARRSSCWQEFHQEFLKAGQAKDGNHLQNFQKLCNLWRNCSQEEAYEALKRIHVETISEYTLRETLESYLAPLVNGAIDNIIDVLSTYALDKIHYELTAHDIWQHLKERGYQRRQWNNDPHILAAVDNVNHLYFSRFDNEKIADEVIPRDEVSLVLDKLTSPSDKHGVLITGEAGVGKSGVMGQVVAALRAESIPLLAFRVDRLEPTQLPDSLGQQLGLPGSSASVLVAISQGRECVLIIDQLDAVSEASGRNPSFFECVQRVIKQAQAHPNVRLLLACRKFDLENDFRLRRLTGQDGILETVEIGRLAHEKITEICKKLGLNITQLTPRQLDLLSIPLHLSLLAEISKDSSIDALSFATAKDLYDYFWKCKETLLQGRLGRPVQWTKVIDILCDYMSSQQKQTLSVPEAIVDDSAVDAKVMASEHVLTWQDKRVSFFHEGFFDYASARRFAARGKELLPFLESSEQHLFRRSQVRQILIHEREADFERYLSDLKKLLTCAGIRFHIKQVVLALIATLHDPRPEEWEVLALLMSNESDPIIRQVWQTLYSSVSWFQLLDSLGLLTKWGLFKFEVQQVPD